MSLIFKRLFLVPGFFSKVKTLGSSFSVSCHCTEMDGGAWEGCTGWSEWAKTLSFQVHSSAQRAARGQALHCTALHLGTASQGTA